MAQVRYTNNAKTTLNGAITDVATSIVVTDGSVFPSLSGGDWFYLTLEDTSLNREVVKVTARSTNTLTVTRAQDGTTARAFSNADKAESRVCAALLTDLVSASYLLSALITVDGSGSGLDADLLDGKNTGTSGNVVPLLDGANTHSGATTFSSTVTFTNVPTISRATPILQFYESDAALNTKYWEHIIDVGIYSFRIIDDAYSTTLPIYTVTRTGVASAIVNFGSGVTLNKGGSTIWHAGNDGSGSTLDADLLDGQEGTYYRNATNINAGTIADTYLPSSMATKTFTSSTGTGGTGMVGIGEYITLSGLAPNILFSDTSASINQWFLSYNQGDFVIGENIASVMTARLTINTSAIASVIPVNVNYTSNAVAPITWSTFGTVFNVSAGRAGLGRNAFYDETGASYRILGTSSAGWAMVEVGAGNGIRFSSASGSVVAGTVTPTWNTVWHAGNDGAGSTLDADLLDGKNTGTSGNVVPLLDGANTHSGATTFSSTVTFSNVPTINRANPILQFYESDAALDTKYWEENINGGIYTFRVLNDAYASSLTIYTVTRTGVASAVIDLGGSSITLNKNGSTIWHAGNDGSGSGLDADLLDGKNTGTSGNVVPLLDGANTHSGATTFSAAVTFTNVPKVSSTIPMFQFYESDAALDTKYWDLFVDGGIFRLRCVDDTYATALPVYTVTRTGVASAVIDLGGSSITLNKNGSTIWHAGNDGSGSGLDADLIRGTTPSAFFLTLVDDAAASNARTTLGLGTAATVATGTSGATIPLLDGNNTYSGTSSFTAAVTMSTTGTGTPLSVTSTDAGAVAFVGLDMYRNSASPAANDVLAQLRFRGQNSTPAAFTYAYIQSTILDPTAASEDSNMQLAVVTGGTTINALTLGSSATTHKFNSATDCIVTSVGTSGYGSFYPQGSGTNTSYVFFGNATSGERARIYATNSRDFILSTDSGVTQHLLINSSGTITASGNTVWHAGNDGAGSTLDADLLDGMNSATAATVSTIAARDSSGQLTAVDFIISSDERLKSDISVIPGAMIKLRQLRGVAYTRLSTGKREIGVIAQDLERAGLGLLVDNTTEFKSVKYPRLVAVLIEAVKELSERIDQLEAA